MLYDINEYAGLPLFLLGMPTADAVVKVTGLKVCQSHKPVLNEHSLVTTHFWREITIKSTVLL